ncbi:MAG: DUF4177 domain-containing protein [Rhodobacteraceae bacterium]|uniref:DUF4177 domain-containing protein n=1 Tax=Celeribacter sp. HF31 TaxID=2721558 RepID=UPI00142FD35E|nr:DUF4177 domain-containing protein [Celeribacter sp. HF31]NIY78345.1 DUF4177 domain-containing protein [Celeribacter sp. HF31]NVK46024.1 DUF4177 domain-containing protein [Paracoccaceae bacterium]
MPRYEYLTLPAPRKGEKSKGAKTPEARIAQAMQSLLNEKGREGWEYLRADLVPMEERAGITSKTVNYHTVLVFRRELGEASEMASTLEAVVEAAPARKSLAADRDTPPPSVPFPAKPEKGAGAEARKVAPDVAEEIAEDRES